MKHKKLFAFLAAAAITLSLFSACGMQTDDSSTSDLNNDQINQTDDTQNTDEYGDDNTILEFRPVDCGIQAQDVYEYPFLGMSFTLSESLRNSMDSRDVFVMTFEDILDKNTVNYALFRFSATTQEHKNEKVMSVDILEWEGSLEKIGAIGVYGSDTVSRLDDITGCDVHTKIGESPNGAYEYYISTNSGADSDITAELKKTEITIATMKTFDPSMGENAFSVGRVENLENVGKFTTQDVFGNTYTESVFAEYDITLVNIFATWCSPCVRELPELEQLRKYYEDNGIKVGIVAVALDARTTRGKDQSAIETAQDLYDSVGAQFPFLIPDSGYMNGRLKGIESVPETFFVDKYGNIVSEPYVGARSLSQWKSVVGQVLKELS